MKLFFLVKMGIRIVSTGYKTHTLLFTLATYPHVQVFGVTLSNTHALSCLCTYKDVLCYMNKLHRWFSWL